MTIAPDLAWLLSPTQLSGYAAFVLGMACFAQTNDRRFKLFMAAECGAYILHLACGVWLAEGWQSLLPIAASCIGTTALFFMHGRRMRAWMLLGTLLWLVNNLAVGSIGGSLLEACLALSNLRTIWRWREHPG